jgi:hypothetical protein
LLQTIGNNTRGCIVVTNDQECWEGLLGDYIRYMMPLKGLDALWGLYNNYGRLRDPFDTFLMHSRYYDDLENNYFRVLLILLAIYLYILLITLSKWLTVRMVGLSLNDKPYPFLFFLFAYILYYYYYNDFPMLRTWFHRWSIVQGTRATFQPF